MPNKNLISGAVRAGLMLDLAPDNRAGGANLARECGSVFFRLDRAMHDLAPLCCALLSLHPKTLLTVFWDAAS